MVRDRTDLVDDLTRGVRDQIELVTDLTREVCGPFGRPSERRRVRSRHPFDLVPDPIDWVTDRTREVDNHIGAVPDHFRDERTASCLRGPLPFREVTDRIREVADHFVAVLDRIRVVADHFRGVRIPAVRIANHLHLGVTVMTKTSNEVLHSLSCARTRLGDRFLAEVRAAVSFIQSQRELLCDGADLPEEGPVGTERVRAIGSGWWQGSSCETDAGLVVISSSRLPPCGCVFPCRMLAASHSRGSS